jgi:PqqD family protein of HPr-rel-A system
MTATASRWQLAAPDELYVHVWDGEVAAYNGATGDTHLLSPLAAAILQSLQRAPATLTELVEQVTSLDSPYPAHELRRYVDLVLGDLRKLGIVEPG